jgi:hypothetical protein
VNCRLAVQGPASRPTALRPLRSSLPLCLGVSLIVMAVATTQLAAQGQGARAGGPPPAPRAAAPIDLTGYWVSVVSEDWRWRMITPPKGDYANIPINTEAKRVGDAWDPAKDEAAGEQCRAYAAPAIMREPGRLHISWQDDATLKLETDAGMQTRVFHFALPQGQGAPGESRTAGTAPQDATPSWQGYSMARWEPPSQPVAGAGLPLGLAPRAGRQGRSLEVHTSRIRPGYLRKNGIPFSADALVDEYYDLFAEPDGQPWFVVTTIVRDPKYLNTPWVTTSHFKKEADASKWNPTPCRVR